MVRGGSDGLVGDSDDPVDPLAVEGPCIFTLFLMMVEDEVMSWDLSGHSSWVIVIS